MPLGDSIESNSDAREERCRTSGIEPIDHPMGLSVFPAFEVGEGVETQRQTG